MKSISEQEIQVTPIEALAVKEGETESERSGREIKVDPIYREAVSIVLNHKQASVSLLQRRLGIGYQRAARLIDKMEENAIVSPFDGSKARSVLIDATYLEKLEA